MAKRNPKESDTAKFRIPENLEQALQDDTLKISFSRATWGFAFPYVKDVADLRTDAEMVGLDVGVINVELLRTAQRLRAVRVMETTPEIVEELSNLPELEFVFVQKPEGGGPLGGLGKCPKLAHLSFCLSNDLMDLSFLSKLKTLRTLDFIHIPRIDLTTLPKLKSLREFVYHGGMHAPLKWADFSALARLQGLRLLHLMNVASVEGSLAPLAKLQSLESVFLSPNLFEVEELARLAASLPKPVRSSHGCLSPFFSEVDYSPCPKCESKRTLLSGKRTRISCLVCDAKRVEKHLARWQAASVPY